MRLWPKTLFGQIVLALFGVLLIVQLLGVWLLIDERGRLNYKLLSEYAAQRMAGIASVLDEAEPAERPQLVKALSVLPTRLSISVPWSADNIDHSPDAQTFVTEALHQLPQPLEIQMLALERIDPIVVDMHPPVLKHPLPPPDNNGFKGKLFVRSFIAQIRLHDGTVVTFNHMLPAPATSLPYRLIALLVLLGASTTVLSIWAVRRLTRPLANFADAATGLAQNLNQPPLPEAGPKEIQQAAHAFNTMQRDIRRLVDTRAQALSAVSHDLRLPITRMRLRLEGDITTEVREKLRGDLTEMDTMIGHTLDFLRAGSSSEAVVAVNLDALLDSLVEDMEELGAHITREGHCTQPIKARPHALRRCFGNLLDNARFYGQGQIHLRITDFTTEIRVDITDNGPGIPQSELDKVFEPYFRLEASRARHTGGTGLGLSIAKAIAENHGGRILLTCRPGEGTMATVILPRG
jgi:signal transduction histidine kinase